MACYEYKGIKYTEQELETVLQNVQPKVRRVLELQSDLFQGGRDKDNLISIEKEFIENYEEKRVSNLFNEKILNIEIKS